MATTTPIGTVGRTPTMATTTTARPTNHHHHRRSSLSSTRTLLQDFWKDDYAPLKDAGDAVLACLRADEATSNADLYRRVAASSSHPTNSNTRDSNNNTSSEALSGYTLASSDYEDLDPAGGGGGGGGGVAVGGSPRVVHLKSIPLPALLQHELQRTTQYSFLGLLVPAQLCWLSVDDKIWLWRMSASAEGGSGGSQQEPICQFQVPTGQPIVTVALVTPKVGVFVETVEWCLVITTPDQVILCALNRTTTNGGRGGEYRLVPTLYALATEQVMLSVVGTKDGRIFLGGDDGSLSEMTYQGEQVPIPDSNNGTTTTIIEGRSVEDVLHDFYDQGVKVPAVLTVDSNLMISSGNNVLERLGKRTWSAIAGANGGTNGERPRKYAKVSRRHRQTNFLSSLLPTVVTQTTSWLMGNGAKAAGKIIKMAVDEHRQTLYTLNSHGVVTAHDLRRSTHHHQNPSSSFRCCSMDLPRVARSYLEAVARGQMYPPTGCSFPGGEASAQAGVGGMEGARRILKAADFGSNTSNSNPNHHHNQHQGDVLKPVSIHVLSPRESQRLTLVAVTSGGLRLYLSTLSPGILSSGPNAATRYSNHPLAPSTFTLCHIRAPPPLSGMGPPGLESGIRHVDASYYHQGTFLAAIEPKKELSTSTTQPTKITGNVILATCPDSVLRPVERLDATTSNENATTTTGTSETITTLVSGGMAEIVSKPLTTTDGVLPGGIVWEIAEIDAELRPVEKLMLMSQTPTDSELGIGVPPAFFPSSKLQASSGSLRSRSGSLPPSTVLARQQQASLSFTALTVLGNALTHVLPAPLARPLRRGLRFQRPTSLQDEFGLSSGPTANYRISQRTATDGYSTTAAEESSNRYMDKPRSSPSTSSFAMSRSARLRSWLLRPASVPLNPLSTLHIDRNKQMVALNAGGLHYFGQESILSKLADALIEAGENVATDAKVTSFFTKYGYKEGCAMCLALAIGCGPADGNATYTDHIRSRASSAALARAFVPRLVALPIDSNQAGSIVSASQGTSGSLIPLGYEFYPSELSSGLVALFSRLVRPMWHKPAVVVTEGRLIRMPWTRGTRATPAKVELLLCEESLKDILAPLSSLLRLMKSVFSRAVKAVPGGPKNQDSMMDIDDEESHLITRSLEYNSNLRAASGASAQILSASEAETIARLIEEKNIHCLFRLLTRIVQLLNLLSLLRRAQNLPELNEVDWGMLHGLTIAQLVQTPEGQERLESLLNTLVTGSAADGAALTAPSAQADQLANQFASECYLFFSPGSRSAYLGFRHANEALACQLGSERRASLAALAADHLRTAAQHWYSASLISGQILHTNGRESVDQVAHRARQYGSPLAKAVDILIRLGDVASAVEVCMITASNFKDQGFMDRAFRQEGSSVLSFPWEYNLYHKRHDDFSNAVSKSRTQASPTQVVTYGASVTAKDAVDTCYALIFFHLSDLLKSTHPLRHNMVSACAATTDADFLESFFRFLLQNGHKDTLLLIDSADLDAWLRNRNDPELLRSYYDVQGRFMEAGQVSLDVACDGREKRPLAERLDWLYHALIAFESAVQYSPANASNDINQKVRVVSDILQIAKIQNRVLATVTSAKTDLTADQLEKLSTTIVAPTELYNDFTAPLGLFEHCLFLLHSCREREDGFIRHNWKGIICEEILPCATRSEIALSYLQKLVSDLGLGDDIRFLEETEPVGSLPLFESGDWSVPLEDRIVRLGKELYQSGADYVFPVDFLLNTLQGLAEFSNRLEPQWPLMVLVRAGVPFLVLLDAFEAFVQQNGENDVQNGSARSRMEHVACIVDLIDFWISCARNQPFGGLDKAKSELTRTLASGRLIPTLTSLKARLQLMPDSSAQSLLDRIADIEDQLQYFS